MADANLKEALSSIDPDRLISSYETLADKITDPSLGTDEAGQIFIDVEEKYPALKKLLDRVFEDLIDQGFSRRDSGLCAGGVGLLITVLKQFADESELEQIIGK